MKLLEHLTRDNEYYKLYEITRNDCIIYRIFSSRVITNKGSKSFSTLDKKQAYKLLDHLYKPINILNSLTFNSDRITFDKLK